MNEHTYLYCWGPAPLRGCKGLLKPLLSVGLMICCNQLYNLNLNVQGCDWLSGIVCLLLQIYVPWGLNEVSLCIICPMFSLWYNLVFWLCFWIARSLFSPTWPFKGLERVLCPSSEVELWPLTVLFAAEPETGWRKLHWIMTGRTRTWEQVVFKYNY